MCHKFWHDGPFFKLEKLGIGAPLSMLLKIACVTERLKFVLTILQSHKLLEIPLRPLEKKSNMVLGML